MAETSSDTAIAAWVRLVRASRAALAAIEADLKAAGFPPLAWYDALLELQRAGGAPMRPYELERRLLLAQYNLSRLLDRLAAAGYIEKTPSVEDGRGVALTLTKQGRALLRRMWPAYRAAVQRHVGDRLSENQAAQLVALLGRIDPGAAEG